jgi:hypothetical protein
VVEPKAPNNDGFAGVPWVPRAAPNGELLAVFAPPNKPDVAGAELAGAWVVALLPNRPPDGNALVVVEAAGAADVVAEDAAPKGLDDDVALLPPNIVLPLDCVGLAAAPKRPPEAAGCWPNALLLPVACVVPGAAAPVFAPLLPNRPLPPPN